MRLASPLRSMLVGTPDRAGRSSCKQELCNAPYIHGDSASIMDRAQRLCKTAVQTVTPVDVPRAADAAAAHGVGAGVHQVPPDKAGI